MENKITYEEYLNAVNVISRFKEQEQRRIMELNIDIPLNNNNGTLLRDTTISNKLLNCICNYFRELIKDNPSVSINVSELKISDLSLIDTRRFRTQYSVGAKTFNEFLKVCRKYSVPIDK